MVREKSAAAQVTGSMMHSDFYALAACAISVLYIPFLVIAQLRFSHIMQHAGYRAPQYFDYLKKHSMSTLLPAIALCGITALGRLGMWVYLNYSEWYEMDYYIGFFVVLVVIAAVIAVVYTIYCKKIKIESNEIQLVFSPEFIRLFLVSCMLVCVLELLVNLMMPLRILVFFLPAFTPFLVPVANALLPGNQAKSQKADTSR